MNERAEAEAERLRIAQDILDLAGVDRWSNLVEMFFAQAKQQGDKPMLWEKSGGAWRPLSWRLVAERVSALAIALRARGVQRGDRVVIVSESRPDFCIWDLAIMAAGAISVPTFTSNTSRDHLHIIENSGAAAAVISSPRLSVAVMEAVYQAGTCRLVIGMEPLRIGQTSGDIVVTDMAELLSAHAPDVDRIAREATMGRPQLACIIYTSGTGGTPRGVMQHHGAILHNIRGCTEIIRNDFPASADPETFLSFLPPSHAYEHTAGQFLPIALGGQIYYAESIERLMTNIAEVRPTIMVVVPRLFEVLRRRLETEIGRRGGMAAKLMDDAIELGRKSAARGGVALIDKPKDFLIERGLRRPIRERFGGRLKALVSGGAPLNPEVGRFFSSIGLTLLQGYGQTEAAPVISCNRPAAGIKMHTVGPPLRDTEVMIAEDGEILVNGELVMLGYWRNEEETANVLRDGWLHTGDIGMFDEDGHLLITDRKKDIIVNDKGDNVSPQRVEGLLTLQPEISQAMVSGDERPYLVGVVVPETQFSMEWAARNHVEVNKLRQDMNFGRAIQAAVDRVNAQLSTTERVRRVILADEPFTVENGEMTPTLKPRRHALRKRYGDRLNALYRTA